MKASLKTIIVVLFLFPYIVAFRTNPSDTASTEFEFAAGTGSYARVSRDCNGNVRSVEDIPYSEFGVSVKHRTASVVTFGAVVGATSGSHGDPFIYFRTSDRRSDPLWYVSPTVGIDTKYFGLDGGCLVALSSAQTVSSPYGESNRGSGDNLFPIGALRLGNRDQTYLSFGLARNLPLLSGGGLLDAGVSFPLRSASSRLWLGLCGYPYDRLAFSAKGEFPLSERFRLTPRLQAAFGESFEYGLSLGGRIIF